MVGEDISPYTKRTTPPATGALLEDPWISEYASFDVVSETTFLFSAAASSAILLPGISITPAFFLSAWFVSSFVELLYCSAGIAAIEDEGKGDEVDSAVKELASDF